MKKGYVALLICSIVTLITSSGFFFVKGIQGLLNDNLPPHEYISCAVWTALFVIDILILASVIYSMKTQVKREREFKEMRDKIINECEKEALRYESFDKEREE